MQPAGQRVAAADHAPFAGQHQKDGLARVFGVLGVTEDAATGAEHERPVLADQGGEGCLVAIQETVQQGVVRQGVEPLAVDQVVNMADNEAGRALGHRTFPRVALPGEKRRSEGAA